MYPRVASLSLLELIQIYTSLISKGQFVPNFLLRAVELTQIARKTSSSVYVIIKEWTSKSKTPFV